MHTGKEPFKMNKTEENKATENKSGIQFIDTYDLKDYSETEAHHTPLLETGQMRTLLLNLNSSQSSPLCKMSVPVLYYVIEGEGELVAGDEHYTLRAGSMATVPAEITRIISATSAMRVLGVQII
jgi:quercetin dioxygenase-like cupin family protein